MTAMPMRQQPMMPMHPMMAPPRRTGSLGCLGAFSVFCLLLFSLVEGGLLLRMNPRWFDRIALWRGKVTPPDVVLVDMSRPTGSSLENDALPLPEQTVKLDEQGKVTARYVPSMQTALRQRDDTLLEVPPGAIGEATELSLTPITQLPRTMIGPHVGPAYRLGIGASEHYTFRTPVRLTIPYEPGTDPSRLTAAVWENGRWTPVPSRVDPQRSVVVATLSHASNYTVDNVGGPPSSPTTPVPKVDETKYRIYRTANFAIHYYFNTAGRSADANAAPLDATYPLANGRASGGHPLFVQDLGAMLEDARAKFQGLRLPTPPSPSSPYKVRILDLGEFGATNVGGEITISSRMVEQAASDLGTTPGDLDRVMRHVAAHELVHAVQNQFFLTRAFLPYPRRWWCELSAAYFADNMWQRAGKPTDVCPIWQKNTALLRLLEFPIDENTSPNYYAHSLFLQWLDKHYNGAGFNAAMGVDAERDMTLQGLDTQLNKATGKFLSQLYTEYAHDFYHDDLWHGELAPWLHKDVDGRTQPNAQTTVQEGGQWKFLKVARGVDQRDGTHVVRMSYAAAGTVAPLERLTAKAVYFQIDPLPEHRKAKLIVDIEPGSAPSNYLELAVAADPIHLDAKTNTLPASGSPAAFQPIPLGSRGILHVVEHVGMPNGPNLVTLVAVNNSMRDAVPGFVVKRWLLLAPSWAKSSHSVSPSIANPNITHADYTLTWQRAELRDYPEPYPAQQSTWFKGYNVYRKKAGQPDEAAVRIMSAMQDEQYIDHPPQDGGPFAYLVKVEDVLGNESEATEAKEEDPFVGTWTGEFQMAEGSLAEPLKALAERSGTEADVKNRAKIAQIADPKERAERQKEWDDIKNAASPVWDKVKNIMFAVEFAAQIGVPLEVEITEFRGEYSLRLRKLMYQPIAAATGKDDDIAPAKLKRVDENTLQFLDVPEEMPPVFLKLNRRQPASTYNEIREDRYTINPKIDGKEAKCVFKWVLERKEK